MAWFKPVDLRPALFPSYSNNQSSSAPSSMRCKCCSTPNSIWPPFMPSTLTTSPVILFATSGNYRTKDFHYDAATNSFLCPAGKPLYRNGGRCQVNGRAYQKLTGAKSICVPCKLRQQCLRAPDKTAVRRVAIFYQSRASPLKHTESMKRQIDSPEGRHLYGGRIATVKPVLATCAKTSGATVLR